MPSEEIEQFTVVYDGGLASTGQLHFYEYGRAAYAVARLVATIENFRRTGRVAQRISSKNYVDVIIRAPEKGSFPIDILIPVGEAIKHASELGGIPVGDFVKYIIHLVTRLLPRQEAQTIELAKIFLENSKQETVRFQEVRKMVESSNINTAAAIDVIGSFVGVADSRVAAAGISQASMNEILQSLQEARQREEEFEPYRERLEKIGSGKLARLARKVRPQIAEAGVPLRRSATRMQLAQGAAKRPFATLSAEAIQDIASLALDKSSSSVNLRFISYDRDHGVGKCDLVDQDLNRISFSVPLNVRRFIKPRIIAALDDETVTANVRFFRNKDKSITSILVEDVGISPTVGAYDEDADEDD